MPKHKFLRRIEFSVKDLLADALMNSIFLIMCVGTCSHFLVSSNDLLSVYFMCYLLAVPAALLFVLRRLSLPVIPMILLHFSIVFVTPLLFFAMDPAVILVTSAAGIALMIYSLSSLFRKAAAYASLSLLILSFFLHMFYLFIAAMRGANSISTCV